MDVDGAVAVVRAAVDFDWTWTAGDVEHLCAHLGWDEPMPSGHDDTLWWAQSGLAVEDAVAMFQLREDRLDTVVLPVTADGCGCGALGAATFVEVVTAFRDVWGDPTGEWISARNGPSWIFEDLVVGVSRGATINLILANPLAQDHWAQCRRTHSDGWANAAEQLTDEGSRFVRLVSGLVQSEFGAWSQDAIEPVLTRLGLPFEQTVVELDNPFEVVDGLWLCLTLCGDTNIEFYELEVSQVMSGPAGDATYQAAFAACRLLLGVPDLIAGGVELSAAWIGEATTIRLTRNHRERNHGYQDAIGVSLSPTEPTQNYLEDRAADWPDFYDDGLWPVAPERWHLQPDVGRRLRPYIGNLAEPVWEADSWEELDYNLKLLFTSLADDLRQLPDIIEIGWAIGLEDAPDVIAHGWFSVTNCGLSTLEDGTVRIQNYPPKGSVGPAMAASAIAAVRACGAVVPHDLWCDAWTVGQPRELVAVRFGLRGDRPAPIERELDHDVNQ
ncbi:DUF6301 family protein [Nocardia sp. NPDC046763]|uniref:DUF6301 family protein n=1 Tax=Nocardia sp. NPDC046763 TaxID=3155256 RepID=UPI003404CBEC